RNVDDLASALLLHVRKRRFGAQPRATHVDRHRLVELIDFHFPEHTLFNVYEISGVVHQHVDTAELFGDFVDHALNTFIVRYIEGNAYRHHTLIANRFDDVIGDGDVGQRDLSALSGDSDSIRFADFSAAAG